MKTSIIIPCHHAQTTIYYAYLSCLKQKKYDVNIEIIIVSDDGFDYKKLLAKLGILDENITIQTYTPAPSSGPSIARNIGIDTASGDIITFLDADDELNPARTAIISELVNHHGIVVDPLLIKTYRASYFTHINNNSGLTHIISLISHPFPYGFTIMRNKINSLFDETIKFAEDTEFKLANILCNNDGLFYYLNIPLYTYNVFNRKNGKSLTASTTHDQVRMNYEKIALNLSNNPCTTKHIKNIIQESFIKKIDLDRLFNLHTRLEDISFFEFAISHIRT